MSNQDRRGSNLAHECPPGSVYDEDTFAYLLNIEWARAERSKHPVRLLLATVEPVSGEPAPISPSSATRLFDGLKQSLRDTDVMGWYRQDRVAGAVLSARGDASGPEMSDLVERRVGERLRQRLPSKIARSLRVRVIQQRPRRLGNG
jgi:hypothetical protein